MSKKTGTFPVVALIALLTGLALGAAWLVVGASAANATVPPGETDVHRDIEALPLQTPSSSTAEGTVFYSGTVTGTHMVWVGAFTTTMGGPPVSAVQRSGPGPYVISVEPGTYYILGGMDADDSAGAPDPAIDPMGPYARNPITITAGIVITGVDLVLLDPPSPPTGTGSISGQISYTGRITGPHNIIIFAGRQGEQGPPPYAAVISGPGVYTLTGVADAAYTIAAFMDLDGDMGPPQPGEPFGWYDLAGDGEPDPVEVSAGNALTAINIALHDPRRYLYLPLILGMLGP